MPTEGSRLLLLVARERRPVQTVGGCGFPRVAYGAGVKTGL